MFKNYESHMRIITSQLLRYPVGKGIHVTEIVAAQSLLCQEDNHDKVYYLVIFKSSDGLYRCSGFWGANLAHTLKENPFYNGIRLYEAEKAIEKVLKEKLKKGYKKVVQAVAGGSMLDQIRRGVFGKDAAISSKEAENCMMFVDSLLSTM